MSGESILVFRVCDPFQNSLSTSPPYALFEICLLNLDVRYQVSSYQTVYADSQVLNADVVVIIHCIALRIVWVLQSGVQISCSQSGITNAHDTGSFLKCGSGTSTNGTKYSVQRLYRKATAPAPATAQ